MLKFLLYSIIFVLLLSGIYLAFPDIGEITINTKSFYLDTTLTVLLVTICTSMLIFTLVIYLIFWLISLPNKVKTLHHNYVYKNKIKSILNMLCIIESKNADKIKKAYDEKILEKFNHPIVNVIKLKTAIALHDKDLREKAIVALKDNELTLDLAKRLDK